MQNTMNCWKELTRWRRKRLIEDENKVLKNCIQQLDQSMTQLGQTYNDLEQYSRRECVGISGIPPVWKEENLNDVQVS
jgi:hypothetical protein